MERTAEALLPRQPATDAWWMCEDWTRAQGKTFFMASRFLPPARRLGIFATWQGIILQIAAVCFVIANYFMAAQYAPVKLDIPIPQKESGVL